MKKSFKSGNELTSVSRRKAVKKIVGGVSALAAYNMLPVRWEKPIIEQVFLPAHAQTSGVANPYTLHDPCTLTLISGNQHMPEAKVKVDGSVTPPAANLPVTITATPEGGTGGAVTFNTVTNAEGSFTGTLTVTGGPGMTSIYVQTHVEGSANDAVCALDLGIRTEDPPAESPYPLSSSPSSISATNNTSDTGDDIYITFDGGTNLALVLISGSAPADSVVGIDTDPSDPNTWDSYDPGANWTLDSRNYVISNNNGGSYFVIFNDGGGNTFRIDFNVLIDGVTPPTATVNSVTVQPWT